MHPTLKEAIEIMRGVLLEKVIPTTVAMAYVADVDDGRDLVRLYIYDQATKRGHKQKQHQWSHIEYGKNY